MSKEEIINDDLEDGEIETDDDDEVVIVSSININKTIDNKVIKKHDNPLINPDNNNYLSGIQKIQKQQKTKDTIGYTDDDFADNIENAIAKELLKDNIPLTGSTNITLSGGSAGIPIVVSSSQSSTEIIPTDSSGKQSQSIKTSTLADDNDDLRQKLKRLRRKHDGMNSGDREKRRKRSKHDFDDREDDRGRGLQSGNDYLDEYEMICMRGGSPPPLSQQQQQQQQQQSHQYGSSGIYDSDEDSNSSYDSYDSGEYQRRLMQDARQRRRNKDRRDMGGGGGVGSRGSGSLTNSILKKRRGGTTSGDKRKHRGDGDSDVEERQPRKMELCKFYLMDCCAKREKCLYMHSDFPCKFYYLGMKSHNSDTCKFSHGKPLTEHLRCILLKHLETAPKEILGEFPRISRENAINMMNTTHIRLLVEHGMEQTPSEFTQSMLTGGIAPNSTSYIPSLLDIVTKPPPSSYLKNGLLNMDNGTSVGGGNGGNGNTGSGNNNNNNNSKNDNHHHHHHHHHKNDRKLDKPRKTRWCNDTKTIQSSNNNNNNNNNNNSGSSSTGITNASITTASSSTTVITTTATSPLITASGTSLTLNTNNNSTTTTITTQIPDYLSLKNLTGVITQKQIDNLANMGIENLNQINQLTVAQLNELGLTISQINEIQLNAMNISKLGLSTKGGSINEKTSTILSPSLITTRVQQQQQQILKQITSSGGNGGSGSASTNNSINKETNKLITKDLGGNNNKDTDLRLSGTSRINQDIDMRVLPSGGGQTSPTTTSSTYNNNNISTGDNQSGDSNIRNDEQPFDYTQYVKDSNINLSDSDDEKLNVNLDNKDVNSPIEDEQELLIDESYYPSDDDKNKSDDEDNNENVLKIDEEKPNDDDKMDEDIEDNEKNNNNNNSKDIIDKKNDINDEDEQKPLQPPTIPSLPSVLPNITTQLGNFSKIDLSASVAKMLNVKQTDDDRTEKLKSESDDDQDNDNNNKTGDDEKIKHNLIKEHERRDPRLREETRKNSYSENDYEDNDDQSMIINSYDPRIMFSSTENNLNQEKRERDPRLSTVESSNTAATTELASYDPRSMYGTNTRMLGTLGCRETKQQLRNPRDDFHNILPRDPRLNTITLDAARYEHTTTSQSSPLGGGSSETTALSSSSSQDTSKCSNYYPEATQRPSMYDGVLNSDSDSSSSTTNKKSDKDMRMTFFVDSGNTSPNCDTDLRLPFKPIPANYIINSDSDSSGGSISNKKSDKDMRMSTFFVDSANSSPNRDTDLRLPFKPILANYIPAKEIDASIKLNAPMVYKVTEIDIPKPDYSEIKRSISIADDSIDPRIRRIFCLPPDPATTIIGPSSTGEITIMTAAQAYDRCAPRVDPRRRKELSGTTTNITSSSLPTASSLSTVNLPSANINTPLTLASPPLGSGSGNASSKTAQVNAQVIDMQSILKSSLWYRDLSSTQKITVNQQLAIVNFELRKYHMDPNVDKVFDMTFITMNQLLQQILRSLGVYITDVGAIENINDITGQHTMSPSNQSMAGSMTGGNNFIDMHQQQHSQLPMGGNQMDPYGMRMMGNRGNFGHPGGMGFLNQYGGGGGGSGDTRPGILGMAPNMPFGHYDPSDNPSGRFDDQQIYNEMGMNPGGYAPGPFGGSFNDGNYFGRSQGGGGGNGPDNNSIGQGGNNRNRNNFRSGGGGGGRNAGNSGGDSRWSNNNNNSRNNNLGNNRGSGGGGGGGNNSRRNNYDNRDNRSRRDNNKQAKN